MVNTSQNSQNTRPNLTNKVTMNHGANETMFTNNRKMKRRNISEDLRRSSLQRKFHFLNYS